MKKLILITGIATLIYACSGSSENKTSDTAAAETATATETPEEKQAADARGIGKFTNVEVGETLDAAMADAGTKVYDVKCASCHKLTDEKLVGPGWKDVTKRRTAEWIMNFSTNTDEMLEKDAEAQAMLEICMVRMPNQNLSDEDARTVYEFMRKNDGIK